jgi:hypothetical protein
MPRLLSYVLVVAIASVTLGYFLTIGRASFQPKTFEYDLVPFYCGGAVTAAHRDPYLVEPLRTCEHAIGPVFRKGTQLVVPDPLPAYDQGAMALVSRLPYPFVQWVWFALEVAACAASAVLLARVCGLPLVTVACTLVISDLYTSSILGQVAAFSTFGLCLTGWSLANGRRVPLAIGLAFGMIEPHLGLPALLGVALWNTPSRVVALCVAGTLGIASLLALPVPVIVEYLTRVIPAHALSELNNQDQLSSAYALHALGASAGLALLLAKANYALALVLGILVSRRAAARFGAAMLPFGATAFALLGGPFLHVTQLAAALPAALLVVGRSPSRPARAAAAILAVPWLNFATLLAVLPAVIGALYLTLRKFFGAWSAGRTAALVAAAAAAEAFAAVFLAQTYVRVIPSYGRVLPNDLAEVTWKAIIDLQQHDHVVLATLAKLPTELAVIAVVAIISREAFCARERFAPT